MPKNFLLEINCEEIPARFLNGIISDLYKKAAQKLHDLDLHYKSIYASGTMRRIALFVEELDDKQPDKTKEIKGPPQNIAFDKKNEPTQAAIGFASSLKLNVKDLIIKNTESGTYVFGVIKQKGLKTYEILKTFAPELFCALYLPVSMRWGEGNYSFVRPIHNIAAVFGKQVVPFEIAGIRSSNYLFFQRSKMRLNNADFSKYIRLLEKNGIILDPQERKNIIAERIKYFEKTCEEKILADDELLNKTANISQNPHLNLGAFDVSFSASLPSDVINTIVKEQMMCFPFLKSGRFLFVTEGKASPEIRSGYENVMNARLRDAKFFWDEDVKTPLSNQLEKMKRIIYHEHLGTMWDRLKRISQLSQFITQEVLKRNDLFDIVREAALLSKADLATHMVSEFPHLQGIMGREYYKVQNKNEEVAQAIFEHYLPRFSGDILPEGAAGAIIGISDRLDVICGCFVSGIVPKGSTDPYALRRAAQGIVSVILKKNIEIPLKIVVSKAIEIYKYEDGELAVSIIDFIKQRFKSVLEEEKVLHDVCDAVLHNLDDLVAQYCKAHIILKAKDDPKLKGIVLSQDRITRITKGIAASQFDSNNFIEDAENEMNNSFQKVKEVYLSYIKAKDYEKALNELARLTCPIEKYFEKILVMHEDEKIKNNRLAFLKAVEKIYLEFADFSRIVI